MTSDGQRLIMSDGTSKLRFLDPANMQETGRVLVTDEGVPLSLLNELEWIKGEVCANVWKEERIACINPQTGKVAKWIDLRGLLPQDLRPDTDDVLNGIAYDAKGDRLFVTGKRWPKLFEIRLVASPAAK
jgi:glutamine cyclotransferase